MPLILVVDDDDAVRHEVDGHLGHAGMTAVGLPAGEAATLTRNLRPDLVLLHCPRADDCLALLGHMRSLPALASVPVVVYSAARDDRERVRALALGAVEHVVRGSPTWYRLSDRVEEHLLRARVARDRARRYRAAPADVAPPA